MNTNNPSQERMPGTPDAISKPRGPIRDAQGRVWNHYAQCWELSPEQHLAVINWMTGVSALGRML